MISKEDHTLIERHVILPYALHYLEQDASTNNRAEVGGEIIEDRMDSAMVKTKTEAILMEYLKRAPG